jgi:diadenosine tetraphosphatase ApaH/serine/threonine PP2A family protein phosphatase
MAHATPQGDLFEYLPMDQWEDRVRGLDADYVLLGHTHIQGIRAFGKTSVVNPGSEGLARDGGGQACYAVFAERRMELKRIPYDVERTVAILQMAPLAQHVKDGLAAVLRAAGDQAKVTRPMR